MKKLKILMLIRNFGEKWPKHKPKFDTITAIEKFADVKYWFEDGDILKIIIKTKFKPDFIFQYDTAWNNRYSPKITGLEKINIPKGTIIGDKHYSVKKRIEYIENNKINIIFSRNKEPFMNTFPQYKSKFRWLPFAVDSDVFKDWKLEKNIDFLLMGQVYCEGLQDTPKRIPPKGRYPFREAVLENMLGKRGFVFNPHPGHFASPSDDLMVNEKYAKELNKAKIFFTCGGEFNYPVAKFFEAPACNTLLLAKPNKDILELGFKDGVNFVACDEFNFYEKALFYLANDKERERISRNGHDFIHNNHTNKIRAKQFIKYIEEYVKNTSL